MSGMMSSPPDSVRPDFLATGLRWTPPLAELGSAFYTALPPQALPQPHWISRNAALARELGLDEAWLASEQALMAFSGSAVLPGSQPVASVYSGHQFGHWAGQLGDGRALLLGELQTPQGPIELQLKGAGRTPYSRMGDGRAVLRSSIREYLCSEAMQGLGIPTTRALCLAGSPAPVLREERETAAVLTRSAPSFLRFGHFEHFSYAGTLEQLKALADHVIARHYPLCRASDRPYTALLQAVTQRTAELLAQWQAVGFCHGVMNTDNMSVLGLTIDYGPFQFLDGFNPSHICNHSDTAGRYAFDRQPGVAHWNLFCLAQALMPLIVEQDQALAALESFKTLFPRALSHELARKLGLPDAQDAQDDALIDDALAMLAKEQVDYPLFWRGLAGLHEGGNGDVRDLFLDRPAFDAWARRYLERTRGLDPQVLAARMRACNPKYVLRNHLAEEAIRAAKEGDFSKIAHLLQVLQSPFDEHPEHAALAGLPPAWAASIAISCSS
jgi:uncharacterized protein YdiU (UPF0061 family)